MTRKLKGFGLMMFALLAIGTTVAAVAQGNENAKFNAASYPATVDASGTNEVLDSYGSTVTCKKASFLNGKLTAASSTLTVTPSYSECSAFGVLPATVITNGCDYMIHVGTTTGISGQYHGIFDIECPAEKELTIDVWASSVAHTGGVTQPICRVHIPTQTGLVGLRLVNTAGSPNDISISGTVLPVKSTQTRVSFLCPAGTSEPAGQLTIINPITVLFTNGSGGKISGNIG